MGCDVVEFDITICDVILCNVTYYLLVLDLVIRGREVMCGFCRCDKIVLHKTVVHIS